MGALAEEVGSNDDDFLSEFAAFAKPDTMGDKAMGVVASDQMVAVEQVLLSNEKRASGGKGGLRSADRVRAVPMACRFCVWFKCFIFASSSFFFCCNVLSAASLASVGKAPCK